MESNIKNALLNTYMHELPINKRIRTRFVAQRPITLSEFMKFNPFLKYENDVFIGLGEEDYYFFHKNSLMWQRLKNFLLDTGFTSEDWGMLISDQKVKKRKNLLLLNKEQISSLSVSIISPGSFTSNRMFDITVADLLKKECARYNKQTITIQRILKELGFTEEDGPFMAITKRDSKNIRFLKGERDVRTRSTYSNFSLCQ